MLLTTAVSQGENSRVRTAAVTGFLEMIVDSLPDDC